MGVESFLVLQLLAIHGFASFAILQHMQFIFGKVLSPFCEVESHGLSQGFAILQFADGDAVPLETCLGVETRTDAASSHLGHKTW